jgi:hypothetical protein
VLIIKEILKEWKLRGDAIEAPILMSQNALEKDHLYLYSHFPESSSIIEIKLYPIIRLFGKKNFRVK